ncbi:MAG: acetylglutamate kinase [Planctomycetes bacterium]|nr:acetylglutamate kinase [Planctomycetota bacterium]
MTDLFKAAPHVRLHRGKTFVIKAGGGTIAKTSAIRQFARQVAVVQALGARVVVVHGGGPQTDALQRMLGEEPRMVDGRRVTTPTAMRALRMATAGELSGEVVACLAAEGAPAVGVSGASSGLLVAKRRAPTRTTEGIVDFGEVGDVQSVDPKPLLALIEDGYIPVVCPPAGDGNGGFLNVNADLTAASIAVALGAAKLVMLTGAPGILSNPGDSTSLLSALSISDLDAMEESGALKGGMRVKAAAIRAALYGGVGRVHVVSGSDENALLAELYTNQGAGTLVTREPEKAPESEQTLKQVTLEPSPLSGSPR